MLCKILSTNFFFYCIILSLSFPHNFIYNETCDEDVNIKQSAVRIIAAILQQFTVLLRKKEYQRERRIMLTIQKKKSILYTYFDMVATIGTVEKLIKLNYPTNTQ